MQTTRWAPLGWWVASLAVLLCAGVAAQGATNAIDIVVGDVTTTSMALTWTDGTGTARAVFVKNTAADDVPAPVNGTTYVAYPAFGNAAANGRIGATGWYCVFNGAPHPTPVVVTNLAPGQPYRIMVCEYTGAAGQEVYTTAARRANPTVQYTARFVPRPDFALPGREHSAAVWADFDGDGALELVLMGDRKGANPPKVELYDYAWATRTFTLVPQPAGGAEFAGASIGSVVAGDLDNDGDLDLAYAGFTGTGDPITRVYLYDAGGFIDAGTRGLGQIGAGELALGDYDNDGNLDAVLVGVTMENPDAPKSVTKLYRNVGGAQFVEDPQSATLAQLSDNAAWADIDRDGDLDLVIAGKTTAGAAQTRMYRNDGGTFVAFAPVVGGTQLYSIKDGDLAWGDGNGDGYPDLILGGNNATPAVRLYLNDGTGMFTLSNTPVHGTSAFPPIVRGSLAWFDADNDGDLDVALAGVSVTDESFARIYLNTGLNAQGILTFAPGEALTGFIDGDLVPGDFDANGTVDLLLTGYTADHDPLTLVYENRGTQGNTPPAAPTGMTATLTPDGLALSWTAPADDSTPGAALTYVLRGGTTPGGSDILRAASHPTGLRRLADMPLQRATTLTLRRGLPNGTSYWSVQAVDAAGVGGPFSTDATVSATHQPDAYLQSLAGGPTYGQGVIDDVLNHVARAEALPGQTVAYRYTVTNAGNAAAAYSITGLTPPVAGWTTRAFDAATAGTEITAAMQAGGWASPVVPAGGTLVLRVELTPDETVPVGGSYWMQLAATSRDDWRIHDTVAASVTRIIGPTAPSDITLTPGTVAEHAPIGTPVGTLAAIDPNVGDTATFAFVAGAGDTDNARFTLDGATLRTATALDFETQPSYTVRLKATDGAGLAVERALTITVTNVNEPPVVAHDADFVAYEGTKLTVPAPGVLANDTDPDGDPLMVVIVEGQPTRGTLNMKPDGGFAYQPVAGWTGVDGFSYRASDGTYISGLATVSITVKPSPALITSVTPAWAYNELPGPTTLTLRGSKFRAGSTVALARAGQPEIAATAVQVLSGSEMTCVVDVQMAAAGAWHVVVTSPGIDAGVLAGGFEVRVPNHRPTASDGALTAFAGIAATGQFAATDPDGQPLTFAIATPPARGAVQVADAAQGTFVYTAHPDAGGTDSFTFTASDGDMVSAAATITVTIRLREVIVDDLDATGVSLRGLWYRKTLADGNYGTTILHDNAGNKGQCSVTFTPVVPLDGSYTVYLRWRTSHASLGANVPVDVQSAMGVSSHRIDQRTGGGTWVPLGVFPFRVGGPASVTIGNLGSTGYVVVDAVRLVRDTLPGIAPAVLGDAWTVAEDGAVAGSVVAQDLAGAPLTYALVRNGALGTAVLNTNTGAFVYTPTPSVSGEDSFVVAASNGARTGEATIRISITPRTVVMDNPAAVFAGAWGTTKPGSSLGQVGADYQHDLNTGKGQKTATYAPNLAVGAGYEVFVNTRVGAAHLASHMPVDIVHAVGTTTKTVNLRTTPGGWVSLGTYTFVRGTAGRVVLRTTGTDGHVIADAVRFIKRTSGNQAPVGLEVTVATRHDAPVGGLLRAVDPEGAALTFAITGTPALGAIALTNATTGAFTYTPTVITGGRDRIAYTASDGVATAVGVLTVEVEPPTVLVDNDDTAGVSIVGPWTRRAMTDGNIGASILSDDAVAKSGKSVTFACQAPMAGRYAVEVRWKTSVRAMASNVPVSIAHADGTHAVTVDQRERGGTWVAVGTYRFDPAQPARITIAAAGSTGYVVVDAVRLVLRATTGTATPGLGLTLATPHDVPVAGMLPGIDLAERTFSVVTPPTRGTVAVNAATGAFVYTPAPAVGGLDRFTYAVSDGTVAATGTVTVDIAPIVVMADNDDAEGVTIVGTWTRRAMTDGNIGPSILSDENEVALKAGRSVTFRRSLPAPGTYAVEVRWKTSTRAMSPSVPVTIVHADGTKAVTVDQTVGGGTWVPVGAYRFTAGPAEITLSAKGAPGYVVVDAVRWVKVD